MKKYIWIIMAAVLMAGMSVSTAAAYSKYRERNSISEQYGYMANELATLHRQLEMAEVESVDLSSEAYSSNLQKQIDDVKDQMRELILELDTEETLLMAAEQDLEQVNAAIGQANLDQIRQAQSDELAREAEARRRAEEEAKQSSKSSRSSVQSSVSSGPPSLEDSSRSQASQTQSSQKSSSQRAGSSSSQSSSRAVVVKKPDTSESGQSSSGNKTVVVKKPESSSKANG